MSFLPSLHLREQSDRKLLTDPYRDLFMAPNLAPSGKKNEISITYSFFPVLIKSIYRLKSWWCFPRFCKRILNSFFRNWLLESREQDTVWSVNDRCTGYWQITLKVAFIQKGLMRLSFLQTDKPNYFPELEFWFFFHSKWLKSCQIRTWSCSNTFFEHSEQLHVLFWHDLSHLEWKKVKILAQENN